jgi:C4-dicarboxylate-specific signal transduction histidine kinase
VPATFSLVDVVHEVAELVRGKLLAGNIQFRVEFGPRTARVKAVRVELQQVLMNLILNAAQALEHHRSDRREIVITTELKDDEMRIHVLDNGPGVPADRLPTVFEPFMTSRGQGMGMGLSICRRLVQNNGGRIEGANRPEGGAVFTFTVPVA